MDRGCPVGELDVPLDSSLPLLIPSWSGGSQAGSTWEHLTKPQTILMRAQKPTVGGHQASSLLPSWPGPGPSSPDTSMRYPRQEAAPGGPEVVASHAAPCLGSVGPCVLSQAQVRTLNIPAPSWVPVRLRDRPPPPVSDHGLLSSHKVRCFYLAGEGILLFDTVDAQGGLAAQPVRGR